jgi:hypothetical protein
LIESLEFGKMTNILTDKEILEILMLLSALESWGFSTKQMIPDYLHERLANSIDLLSSHLVVEIKD